MNTPTELDVDALVGNPRTRIVVCCGAGGVGKTTTAAALALHAAEQHGRRTVVLTIDPARRLAQAMGLAELDNVPRRVAEADGELFAMMLDMKRTFDEVVLTHTDAERAKEIFDNPFYQAMSSTFAGTQEYMAMEKLGQLRAADEWDLIVVDTPPSRSALDFLDAPKRMARFLDGRVLRLLRSPARAGGLSVFTLVTASFGVVTKAMTKVLGSQLLTDISGFVAALDSLFGDFRQRADRTFKILQNQETAFIVVAVPEPDALREAAYFAGRLAEEKMPLAGLVLNRVHRLAAPDLSAERAMAGAETIMRTGGGGNLKNADTGTADGVNATAEVLRMHADMAMRVARERRLAEQFLTARPDVPVFEVPALPEDIHNLDALRSIC
ncbi:MAG: ArsA family ATPase [Longispora sp.]|nr:ArsA family ATPase [Longispora sp. (in: high G+C Gram-positive bacteria)]